MRLGGPLFGAWNSPQDWAELVRRHGYSAAQCPIDDPRDGAAIAGYAAAAARAGLVIAEVGAWSNPISPDPATRQAAVALCKERLAVAEAIGARCCVNIAGSMGQQWDGPYPANLTADTFALIVDTVRSIIDSVKPTRTYYTLEAMPWVYPDSPESYLAIIRAVNREAFAVHLDPVNLVCSPQRYFDNAALIRACFDKLGPYIKSCHAKDVMLRQQSLVHLEEVRPGLGSLDYRVYLQELSKLDPDTPLMLEHLASAEEYSAAAQHIRSVAQQVGVAYV
jgi:sugar phosphate isomerase/epimerase